MANGGNSDEQWERCGMVENGEDLWGTMRNGEERWGMVRNGVKR